MKKTNNRLKTISGLSFVMLFMAMMSINPLSAKVLKYAHIFEISHPVHEVAVRAAENLKKKTKGRWEIKVFPASSLGGEAEINEGLSLGTVDIAYVGGAFLTSVYPPIAIAEYPYMFRNFDHWRAYMKSDLFGKIKNEYSKKTSGNEIMAGVYFGTRHVISSRPIRKPSDMKGLKIRVPDAPAFTFFPRVLGGNPAPIAYSEAYLALQQGVVDAVENPLPSIKSKKFYELRKNISLTGHQITTILITVSGITLSGMNKNDQQILRDVMVEAADWGTAKVRRMEAELKSWFEKQGITFNDVNRQDFINAVSPHLVQDGLPFTKKMYYELQAIRDAK